MSASRLIVLLSALWLALLAAETMHVAGRAGQPAIQSQVEQVVLERGARLALYADGLDASGRATLLEALPLTPAQRRLAQGETVPPGELAPGWFRDEASGKHDPARERVAAERDLVGLALGIAWLSATLLGGTGVLIWWLWRGRHLLTPPPELPVFRAWLIFLTWQLGAMVLVPLVVGLVGAGRHPLWMVVAAQLLAYGLGLAYIRPLVGPRRSSWRGLAQGLAAFWVAALAVMAAGQLVLRLTGKPLVSRNQVLDLFHNTGAEDLFWLGLLVVLAGPVFEEYLFRGLLFGAMRRYGEGTATLISATLFALAHRDPAGFLPYLALGAVFARTYAMTGSLFPSMVAHGLFNGQTFVLLCLLSAG